jgi:putative CocE/NonD family hydrolase
MKTRIFLGAAWVCAALAAGAADELSFTAQTNVPIAMRDGTKLTANIFMPKEGGPFPVILMRTPYGKPAASSGEAKGYTAKGYVFVAEDCRGRGNSEGVWDPFRYDPEDGFDTQEWVGHQSWCNGKIGTTGGSYVGWTQWASAPHPSKYLTAMAPIVPFADVYHQIAYPGGALQLSLLFGWGAGVGGLPLNPAKFMDAFKDLPLQNWDDAHGKNIFFLDDWVAHSTFDDYWKKRGINGDYENITVPILNIGGWYDIFSKTTLDLVQSVRDKSKSRLARRNQFAVMGPWGHGVGGQKLGDLDFGADAKLNLGELQSQWFDYWLKDKETGVQNWPAYKIFVMGENRWRSENEWPLARTKWTSAYLHSSGKANSANGNGILDLDTPQSEEPDKFSYDPANPVPTKGGNNLVGPPTGPYDQTAVEDRQDVLVYTSKALEHSFEITGPVKMILYAGSTARDTDFTAKLVDVHPDGKAYLLCDGIVRARYRDSETTPELIEPGKVYKYEIDLWVTSNVFLTGHRVRVEVSSSNFPRFDRNPNTGHAFGADAELAEAKQTIYHDAEHPSHLILPLIPKE